MRANTYTALHMEMRMRANLYMSDSYLYMYVCMNVSHRNKSQWEISPFSDTILCNEGYGDHREIS